MIKKVNDIIATIRDNEDITFGYDINNDFKIVIDSNDMEKEIEKILKEKLNIEDSYKYIVYSDEIYNCNNCNKILYIEDKSTYALFDYKVECLECLDKYEYLELIINNIHKANYKQLDNKFFTDNDFILLDKEYCVSLHNESDNIKNVFNQLKKEYKEIVFNITDSNMFEVYFNVYVK